MIRKWMLVSSLLVAACAAPPPGAPAPESSAKPAAASPATYFDNTGRTDVLTGGARMIPIRTPKGEFHVWTKRIGNNPKLKVLLLHGGPGGTHEYFEGFDSFFPGAGVEYYYYDQLGSAFSDQPDEPSLWEIPRFVDEVEQVRTALGLGPDNFVLLGHSWGGILAIEYALAHGEALKGLVVSNMVSSIPEYNRYAKEVLMPKMDAAVLAEVLALEAKEDFENPRYMELLLGNFYDEHLLRMDPANWPPGVLRGFGNLNKKIHPYAGPERDGRERRAGEVGPERRSRPDRGPDAGHRRGARHDGAGAHGMDGETVPEGPLSLLPERQPSRHVRRPGDLHGRPARVPSRPRERHDLTPATERYPTRRRCRRGRNRRRRAAGFR
jgi:proline iminopeptidase